MKKPEVVFKIDAKHYCCFIPKHNIYFSSPTSKGESELYRKAEALIKLQNQFLKEQKALQRVKKK